MHRTWLAAGLCRGGEKKDAQLSQKDRAAGCVIVLAKSGLVKNAKLLVFNLKSHFT